MCIRKGFTLVELIISVGIFAIVTSMVTLLLHLGLNFTINAFRAQDDEYHVRAASLSISKSIHQGVEVYEVAENGQSIEISTWKGDEYMIFFEDGWLKLVGDAPSMFIEVPLRDFNVAWDNLTESLVFKLVTENGLYQEVFLTVNRVRE